MFTCDFRRIAIVILMAAFVALSLGCNKTAKETNKPVVINSFSFTVDGVSVVPADILQVEPGSIVAIEVSYTDPDAGENPDPGWYTFAWAVKRDGLTTEILNANEFFIVYNENPCVWVAPVVTGKYTFDIIVGDHYGSPSVGHVSVLVDSNKQPVISDLEISSTQPYINEEITITATADDPDGNTPLEWTWQATGGYFSHKGDGEAKWISPVAGDFQLTIIVTDQKGGSTSQTVPIKVLENHAPVIQSWILDTDNPVPPDTLVKITLTVNDPDGDALTYNWSSDQGAFNSINQNVANWHAPSDPATCTITCEVNDGKGGSDSIDIIIVVQP
ncbi:MAG: hypothetical protein NTY09_03625 [bacterium]|nr:hypothetical protein [bacterium]